MGREREYGPPPRSRGGAGASPGAVVRSPGFPGGPEAGLRRFGALGPETVITELDLRTNLPEGGVPVAGTEREQGPLLPTGAGGVPGRGPDG